VRVRGGGAAAGGGGAAGGVLRGGAPRGGRRGVRVTGNAAGWESTQPRPPERRRGPVHRACGPGTLGRTPTLVLSLTPPSPAGVEDRVRGGILALSRSEGCLYGESCDCPDATIPGSGSLRVSRGAPLLQKADEFRSPGPLPHRGLKGLLESLALPDVAPESSPHSVIIIIAAVTIY
jgi:hypothetical protein